MQYRPMALFSFTPHNLISIHNVAEGIFFYGLGAVIGGSVGATAVVLDYLNKKR